MILDPTTAIVGTIAFGLHLAGKKSESPVITPLFKWLKANVEYILYSLALCTIGVLLRHEIMEPLGFTKEGTFVAIVCYGGAHIVARFLGMKDAKKERAAEALRGASEKS